MEINIDLNSTVDLLNNGPAAVLWFLFVHGGWIFLLLLLVIAYYEIWLYFKRHHYILHQSYVMLAIDIPKNNEQSLVAVEQMFATLHGIKSSPNLIEKYLYGETQLPFSLEIVSMEGYIQFLIRTVAKFRDLVEAAIYAQYPEAEITEVNDYVHLIPQDIYSPDHEYKFWCTEYTLDKSSCYPIKTYRFFEHQLTQTFTDPMSALLEVMSKLGPGEQIGMQLVIAPVGNDWKKHAEHEVKHLIGEKLEASEHLGDKMVKGSLKGLETFSEAVYSMWGEIEEKKEEKDGKNNWMQLTEAQKAVVTAIENKLAKLSFGTTLRIYYMGKRDRFEKGRGVNGLLGAFSQFSSHDLNSFKKFKRLTAHADYFFVKSRTAYHIRRFAKLYRQRSRHGSHEFFLGTEELATLYHFPAMTVKAPLLKRTDAKKAEPPTALPFESAPKTFFDKKAPAPEHGHGHAPIKPAVSRPAPSTPHESETHQYIVSDSLPGYDFDNDYYEERFASKKPAETIKKPESPIDKSAEPPANLPFVE